MSQHIGEAYTRHTSCFTVDFSRPSSYMRGSGGTRSISDWPIIGTSASFLIFGRSGVVSSVLRRTYVVQLCIHKGRVWRHEVFE